jgi:hypothetical protein
MTAAAKVTSESPIFKRIAYDATKGHIRLPNGKTYAVSQFAVGKKEIIGAQHPKTLQDLSPTQRQAIFKFLDAMVADKEIKKTLTLTKHSEIDFSIKAKGTSLVATIAGKVLQKKEADVKDGSEEVETKEAFSTAVNYSAIKSFHESLVKNFSKDESTVDESTDSDTTTDEGDATAAAKAKDNTDDAEVDSSDESGSDDDADTAAKSDKPAPAAATAKSNAKTDSNVSGNKAGATATPNGKAAAPVANGKPNATPNGKPATAAAAASNGAQVDPHAPLSDVDSELEDEPPFTSPKPGVRPPDSPPSSSRPNHVITKPSTAPAGVRNIQKELEDAAPKPGAAAGSESDEDDVKAKRDGRAENESGTESESGSGTDSTVSKVKTPANPASATPAKPATAPAATASPLKPALVPMTPQAVTQTSKDQTEAEALKESFELVEHIKKVLAGMTKEDIQLFLGNLKLWYGRIDKLKEKAEKFPNSATTFENSRIEALRLIKEDGGSLLELNSKDIAIRTHLLAGAPLKSGKQPQRLQTFSLWRLAGKALGFQADKGTDEDLDIDNDAYQWLITKLLTRCLLFKNAKEIREFTSIQTNLTTVGIFKSLGQKVTQHPVYNVLKPFYDNMSKLSPRKSVSAKSATAPAGAAGGDGKE